MISIQKFRYLRTVLLFIAALFVFFLLLDIQFVSKQRNMFMVEERKQVEAELGMVATFVTEPLLRHEFSKIEEFLNIWCRKNPDVLEFRAITPNGFSLVDYSHSTTSDYVLESKREVLYENNTLLTLEVAKDLAQVEDYLSRLHRRNIISAAIMVSCLGIVLWLILMKLAVKPLEKEIERRKETEKKLQNSLDEVKTLRGILPICSSCKKIRDDKGYWKQIESYIESHSDAAFSHGLCESCADTLYQDEGWYSRLKE